MADRRSIAGAAAFTCDSLSIGIHHGWRWTCWRISAHIAATVWEVAKEEVPGRTTQQKSGAGQWWDVSEPIAEIKNGGRYVRHILALALAQACTFPFSQRAKPVEPTSLPIIHVRISASPRISSSACRSSNVRSGPGEV